MSHRSGPLKQQNKPHGKLGHQSKRKRKRVLGGRVGLKSGSDGHSKASAAQKLRDQRANFARQKRLRQREELLLKRRLGSRNGPPKVVAFLSLSAHADGDRLGLQLIDLAAATSLEGGRSQSVTLRFAEPKLRATLIRPDRSIDGALEAARVADVVLLLLDMRDGPDGALDDMSEVMLTLLKAQGLPTVVGAVLGVDPKTQTPKVALAHKTWAKRFFATEFVDAKVWDNGDLPQLVRLLSNATPKPIHWRDVRSYILTDSVSVVKSTSEASEQEAADHAPATLRVEGYVRGRPLNVNRLVHVPNIGTYRLRRILAAKELCPLPGRARAEQDMDKDEDVLAEARQESAEPLEMEAEGDPLAGEQTWPTADEYPELEDDDMDADDADDADGPKQVRRLPKGLTDAQKAWFDVDDENGHVFGDFDEDDQLGFSDEEYEEVEMGAHDTSSRDGELFVEDLATMEELRFEELQRRRRREKEERDFPDEVDTPLDHAARARFAKYRALKSFRTSPWHKHEALPPDYSRVHGFEDFRHVQKVVLEDMAHAERVQNKVLLSEQRKNRRSKTPGGLVAGMDAEDAMDDASVGTAATGLTEGTCSTLHLDDGETYIPTGTYVALEVVDVPEEAAKDAVAAANGLKGTGVPLAVSSLLPHENRLSVVHFNVQRLVADNNIGVVHSADPIKSKDELRFVCGFRSWTARPVFSEVSSGADDKQRFERFLPIGGFVSATAFGPVCYRPCPVLIFRDERDEEGYMSTQLLATGTLDAVDPDRLIIKRVLLTGYPVKVHKRSATVKYMFFNKKDVAWFKPAELFTKHGLVGHIRESLGEQGLMKCAFNERIKQHDTVCLALYKRVFPKFPASNHVQIV